MATFFRSSKVWVVDFRYEGRPRQWLKALPEGANAAAEMERLLAQLYGKHAQMTGVRPATREEEDRFLHGDAPRNALCPTGRAPRGGDPP